MKRGSNRGQGRSSAFKQLLACAVPFCESEAIGRNSPDIAVNAGSKQVNFILKGLSDSIVNLRETGFILESCGEFEEIGFANHESAGAEVFAVELAAELAEELSIQVADNACEASEAHRGNVSRAHIQRLLG